MSKAKTCSSGCPDVHHFQDGGTWGIASEDNGSSRRPTGCEFDYDDIVTFDRLVVIDGSCYTGRFE